MRFAHETSSTHLHSRSVDDGGGQKQRKSFQLSDMLETDIKRETRVDISFFGFETLTSQNPMLGERRVYSET